MRIREGVSDADMSEESGVEAASPAAAAMSRRDSRSAIPERLKEAAREKGRM